MVREKKSISFTTPKSLETNPRLQQLKSTSFQKFHRDAITAIRFSLNGQRIITVSKDGFIKVYCQERNKQLVSFSISNMPLTCLQLLPDGNTCVVGSSDNNVYLFNMVQCVSTQPMDYAHDDSLTDLSWQHDYLLSCANDCSAKIWTFPWSADVGMQPDVDLVAILDHDQASDRDVSIWSLNLYRHLN
jgi:F-box and WD-40 domain protein 1/11